MAVDWISFDRAEAEPKLVHAFMDSNNADDLGIRLRLLGRERKRKWPRIS
jgi:hypothetical protein